MLDLLLCTREWKRGKAPGLKEWVAEHLLLCEYVSNTLSFLFTYRGIVIECTLLGRAVLITP